MKRQQTKVTVSKGRRGFSGEWTDDGLMKVEGKFYGIDIGSFVEGVAEVKHVVVKVEEEKADDNANS